MKNQRNPNYSVDEVEALIDFFGVRYLFMEKLTWLVRFCDVDLAIQKMPPKEYQAVLLVGLLGLPLREVAKEVGVGKDTVWKRYRRGLEYITTYLNYGGKS